MNPYDPGIQGLVQQLRQEFDQKLNHYAGGLRKATDARLAAADRQLQNLADIAKALQGTRTASNTGQRRIEDIPGRRVPYDLLIDIPIGANTTSTLPPQSVTISQEGAFVAVKRYATFQSLFEFQVDDGTGQLPRFTGRSFGRYRPIHSAWDTNDANQNAQVDAGGILLSAVAAGPVGAAIPSAAPAFPSAASSFRTMEFDGRFAVENAGSSVPRQNNPMTVPSSLWTPQINAPQELGCLDFFERGEIISVTVQPNHVNNPPAGNVTGACVFPQVPTPPGPGGWPFLEGQYDIHEGICTPDALTVASFGGNNIANPLQQDVITRLPDGILTIGWIGYRIYVPVGPVT